MIVYICKCGSQLIVDDNSELSRKKKRVWKALHHKSHPNHGYQRNTVRRSAK